MDIINTEYAMERALQLIDALDAGDIVDGVIDCNDGLPAPRKLEVEVSGVNALLGLSIPGEEMAAVLNRLCIPTELRDGTLHCEFPSFREDMEGQAERKRSCGFMDMIILPASRCAARAFPRAEVKGAVKRR